MKLSLKVRMFYLIILLFPISSFNVFSQSSSYTKDPEGLIKHLYNQVTFPAGETPDWGYVRTLFLKEATVVMRMGENKTAALSLDGWILDFVNFINNRNIKTTGFEENIIKMESIIFGDIAHVLVLYTSYIPGVSEAPREGVDSFHLIRKDGDWKIVSILNEIPGPNRPKPAILLD